MVAWLAVLVAVAAAGISLWGTWIARRALSVSRDAVEIEQRRRHEELTPQIRAQWQREQMGEVVWFHNEGPRSYAEVTVRVRYEPHPYGPDDPEREGPVWLLKPEWELREEEMKADRAVLSLRLGELPSHARRRAEVVRRGWPAGPESIQLVFQVICRSDDQEEWALDVPCQVPGWDTELMSVYRRQLGLSGLP